MRPKNNIDDLTKYADFLEGDIIKEIFLNADNVSVLHRAISSPRGNYFRRRLLQMIETKTNISEIEKIRLEVDINESKRHLNKLVETFLIEQDSAGNFKRTEKGEKIINALRELETDIGKEEAKKLFSSFLGSNAIRLFLRAYGTKKEVDFKTRAIVFTPSEIGGLSLFLRRSIEGIAALDKLSDAELLVYNDDDGNVYLNPKKARAFYKYLKSLNKLLN